jgi:hypothetical protein
MLVGDFSRPWKGLGGFKYLYVNPDGQVQYCSQVPGARVSVEAMTREDLRRANVHKACEPGCAVSCVRTVSHAMGDPLGAVGASFEILADLMRPRSKGHVPGTP